MKSTRRKRAFTLVEMLVVIAIISILASLLMPSLGKAIEQGRLASCMNQQRGTMLAMQTYVDSHNGFLPPYYYSFSPAFSFWPEQLVLDSGIEPPMFVCPSLSGSNYAEALRNTSAAQVVDSPMKAIFRYVSYGMTCAFRTAPNAAGHLLSSPALTALSSPGKKFLTMDSYNTSSPEHGGYLLADHYVATPNVSWSMIDNRHMSATVVMYADGHSSTVSVLPGQTKAQFSAAVNPYIAAPFNDSNAWKP